MFGNIGIGQFYFFSVNENLSFFRLVYSRKHFNQRGFSGAVFSDQAVHLTGPHLERHII